MIPGATPGLNPPSGDAKRGEEAWHALGVDRVFSHSVTRTVRPVPPWGGGLGGATARGRTGPGAGILSASFSSRFVFSCCAAVLRVFGAPLRVLRVSTVGVREGLLQFWVCGLPRGSGGARYGAVTEDPGNVGAGAWHCAWAFAGAGPGEGHGARVRLI